LAVAAAFSVDPASGAPIAFVVPNDLATMEGASAASWPETVHAQYIYAASQFAALPGGGYITGIRWRPDNATTSPAIWSVDALTIAASVTKQAPDGPMSLTYADNVTGVLTVVRATAPWEGGTENVDADGIPGGPRKFDIVFDFDVPFRYNPEEGNLLLDISGDGLNGVPTQQDRLAADDQSRATLIVNWIDVSDPIALARVGSMAMELLIVPLPGDYNQDFVVDALDYDIWCGAYGSTVTAYTGADGSGNGIVDAADYTVWRDRYGGSVANGGVAISIPEPTILGLLFAATPLISGRRTTR